MAANGEANLLIKIKESGKESLKDVSDGLDEIKVKAALVSAALTGFIGLSIKSYGEAEQANNSLSASIANQGLDVDKLMKKYEEYAKTIQQKTTFDDDQVKSGIAIAQSMVGQLELTEDLIKATVDFAARTGTDLNSAFSMVGKTIGTNTNALARNGIEINENATASEKLAAVTLGLQRRSEGAAEALAKGVNGSLAQLKNSFGELVELIGEQFAPYVVASAKYVKELIESFQTSTIAKYTAAILAAGAAFTGLIATLGGLVALLPTLTTGLNLLGIAFRGLLGPIGLVLTAITGLFTAWQTNFLNIQEVTFGVINAVKALFVGFVNSSSDLFSNFGKLLKGVFLMDMNEIKSSFDNIKKSLSDLKNASGKAYDEAYKKRTESLNDSLDKEKKLEKDALEKKKKQEEASSRIRAENRKKEEELDFKRFEEKLEYEKKNSEDLLKYRIEKAEEAEKLALENYKNMISSFVKTTESFVSNGIQGLAGNFLSYLGDSFLPGIGGAIGSVFNLLSQNTDQFKETLNRLFGPEFIANILNNFITLIEQLPEILTKIINFLSENMPAIVERLINAIIANLPEITTALLKAFIKMFMDPEFIAGLAAAVVKGFISGIREAIGEITEGIKKAIKDAFREIGNIGGSLGNTGNSVFKTIIGGVGGSLIGGSLGSVAGAIGGAFGFNQGGIIPAYANGGLIDNQLARVTAGEFITNKDSTSANLGLLNAINNSNGRSVGTANNIVINVNGGLLGDRQSAREFAVAIDTELYRLRQANEARSFDRSIY